MNTFRAVRLALLLAFSTVSASVFASIVGEGGPFRVELTTQPRVIPVGKAQLLMEITDKAGKPIDGLDVRAIARMPGMFMGEREAKANAVPGSKGRYSVQAAFPMGGAYEIEIKVSGQTGSGAIKIAVSTGQDTGGADRPRWIQPVLLVVGAGLVVAFVLVRMRKTGQTFTLAGIVNRGTVVGVLLLVGMWLGASYAVQNWRRPGAMTPIEAQVMEMNTPAPLGTTAVELDTVLEGPVSESVRYAGQAVGYVEQAVNARTSGVVISMAVYVGDRVKRGQVLARLDTSQLDPQLAERAAMSNMASRGVAVASSEYQAAQYEVSEARAELAVKQGAIGESEAMVAASREDRLVSEAEVRAVESELATSQAEVVSADQESQYRKDELERNRELYKIGAVSRSLLQEMESMASSATAKAAQARSAVRREEARLQSARAAVRKSEAMIQAAERRVKQARSELSAARAKLATKEKLAVAASQGVEKERAGAAQARAGYDIAAAQRGYASLVAEADGVVIERTVSPGTLVDVGQTLLRVAQISPIRLQANVAQADLDRIHVGSPISVTATGKSVSLRVSSISPGVDSESRTAVVEALYANSDGMFKPGQFVEMNLTVGQSEQGIHVPHAAIQRPPGQASPFVWVADAVANGRYAVRRVEVELGATNGVRTEVKGPLKRGERVVTGGAKFLREGGEVTAADETLDAKGPIIEVTLEGFVPATIEVPAGNEAKLTFVRRTDQTCGTEVVFPDLGIEKKLPLNEPVEVVIPSGPARQLNFSCAMDMVKGKVVVK